MIVGHVSEDQREQSLQAHLDQVAQMSGEFAQAFGMRPYGEWIGRLHDLGKALPKSQKRMRGEGGPVDHSTYGAQIAWGAREGEAPNKLLKLMAYPIAGHHAGLPDGGTSNDKANPDGATLMSRMVKPCGSPECDAFAASYPHKRPSELPKSLHPIGKGGFSLAFWVRMLYSCLVDADFLDTEAFMSDGAVKRAVTPPIASFEESLARKFASFGEPTTELARIRTAIREACERSALLRRGLFLLTVPTGGGKTLASLAFAVRHAREHGLRRIVYTIPYTSIIEQNAQVFEEVLGRENVLTHYADAYAKDDGSRDADDLDQKRLACENWDAPLIVTTNVRFFESLYDCRSSACRKLHNLAQSVIILDEAQMLPSPLLIPCVRVLAELVVNYGCTVLLMSATQPPLAQFLSKGTQSLSPEDVDRLTPIEIIDDVPALFSSLQRVRVQDLGTQTNDELIARLCEREQALCIVNTKKHARALYDALPDDGRFYLTTLLTPLHRKQIIAEIKRRLGEGLPCRVVSTSLIEAGVDVDFPVGFRARTGLDSILQTAGRVNREGKRPTDESVLYVFDEETEFTSAKISYVAQPASVCRAMFRDRANPPEPTSPEAISEFFNRLYQAREGSLDQKDIVDAFESVKTLLLFPFQQVKKDFVLIEQTQSSVIVARTEEERKLRQRLLNGEYSRELIRALGGCAVGVYPNQLKALEDAGTVTRIVAGKTPLDLYLLQDDARYREDTGLDVSEQTDCGMFH